MSENGKPLSAPSQKEVQAKLLALILGDCSREDVAYRSVASPASYAIGKSRLHKASRNRRYKRDWEIAVTITPHEDGGTTYSCSVRCYL